MKTFVAALATELAPSTVGTVYAVLRMVMQAAVDDGLLLANPCARVPLPRVEKRVVESLSPDSVRAVADAITPRYEVAVWLAAGAGLREGQALGLLVSRIDFLRRRLHIEEQLQGNGTTPILSPLKTKASRRTPRRPAEAPSTSPSAKIMRTQCGLETSRKHKRAGQTARGGRVGL